MGLWSEFKFGTPLDKRASELLRNPTTEGSEELTRAIGAIMVYDITKKESFESLPKWIADTTSTSKHNIVQLMIGNKTDLEDQ